MTDDERERSLEELGARVDAMAVRLRAAKAEQNAKGYDWPLFSADLTHEQVETGLIDRTGWAPGPWDGEPDQVMWAAQTPPHYRCMVSRVHAQIGSLCGYVAIPPGHPAHGLDDYAEVLSEIDVHGGLTFAGRGVDDSWVLGFDCNHGGQDIAPGLHAILRRFAPAAIGLLDDSPFRETYKTVAYVRAECESLAAQLARLAGVVQP
jgi:hypothetical protein